MTHASTTEDLARRMEHAGVQAAGAGLTGVLVTPGPDRLYFTGYAPIAITLPATPAVAPEDGGRRLNHTSHDMRIVARERASA